MSINPFKVCLVSDSESIQAAVRVSCLPPHQLHCFALAGFLDTRHEISTAGKEFLACAEEAHVVLVSWHIDQAPLLDTLCYHVRSKAKAPVLALCGAGQEEMLAALMAGFDEVVTLPLFMPLLQAKVASYRRVIRSVRRATAKKVKKKLENVRSPIIADAVIESESLLEKETIHPDQRRQSESADGKVWISNDSSLEIQRVNKEVFEQSIEAGSFRPVVKQVATGLMDQLTIEIKDAIQPESTSNHELIQVGNLQLDTTSYRCFVGQKEVELTPKEFELLHYLMQHPEEACTRDQILEAVWGLSFDTGTNMVDVYIHFIRRKLKANGLSNVIQTVRGRGYRLVVTEAAPPCD